MIIFFIIPQGALLIRRVWILHMRSMRKKKAFKNNDIFLFYQKI